MHRAFQHSLSLVLLALAAATPIAHAQGSSAHAQSIAEARRNGDLLAPGELGLTERQLHPQRFGVPAQAAGKTRDQVRAELAQARRDGDLILPGEIALPDNQLHPLAYPARTVLAGNTREQVRAQTLEAIRAGDILAGGEAGLPLRQLYPQRYLARGDAEPVQRTAGGAAPLQAH